MNSVINTFNTAVTETASEILGKTSSEGKPLGHCKFFDLCDKRRELRKKRLEPEGSEKYKEVHNNIKRCMKKTKENWIGEQCREIEENLRNHSSKRAYQLVKYLTTVKQAIATTDRILISAVQSQGRWRSISTELSPDRYRRRPPHPSQRIGGCSTITEEKEVSWS